MKRILILTFVVFRHMRQASRLTYKHLSEIFWFKHLRFEKKLQCCFLKLLKYLGVFEKKNFLTLEVFFKSPMLKPVFEIKKKFFQKTPKF